MVAVPMEAPQNKPEVRIQPRDLTDRNRPRKRRKIALRAMVWSLRVEQLDTLMA